MSVETVTAPHAALHHSDSNPPRWFLTVPELPEVEIMTRNARRWMQGLRVADVHTTDAALAEQDWAALVGQRVADVHRVAKVMLVELDDHVLTVHFRMTGKWVRLPHARPPRLTIELRGDEEAGVQVALIDTRRLGRMELLSRGEWSRLPVRLGHGPEPFPGPLPWKVWRERLDTRVSIKVALLDGHRISGLGNICASEILWRARIHPETPAASLTVPQWKRLAEVTTPWLHDVVAEESGDEIGYVNETGRMPDAFAVYGREGEPCRTCAEPIERLVQGGRSSFFCPVCQAGSQRRRRRRS